MSEAKRKVAILGGGAGALATAFELSSLPNWKDRFDITIYQLGWRLGGKGASGRNREHCNRIEEHGIHLWLGYYENAFGVIQKCYAENARPLSAPLATWEEAFKPINCHVMEEQIDGKAEFWPVHFAPAAGNPGDGKVPTHWEALCLALDGLAAMFRSAAALPGTAEAPGMFSGWEKFLVGILEASVLEAGELLLAGLSELARVFDGDAVGKLIKKIEEFLQWLWDKLEKHCAKNSDARHFWYLMDFGFANLRGYLADDVKNKGFDSLNDIDYREWLHKHGASEITLHSPAVNWAYNFMLHDRSTLAAGVMLHVASRALLSCKGAIYWKMQAGMGDVVFAPLYEVLKKRGVKFEFFHRVKKLSLSEDGNSVAEIQLGRQATVRRGEYRPLFNVKGLPCWPSEPLYEQLVEGEELKKREINLESYWTPWEDVAEARLQKGVEFDDVVLGISLAGVPAICGEIIAAKPAWKNMVEKITTTPTQAFQVWTYPDAAGLGWPAWRMPVAVALTSSEPINSWADMSDIILREEWPEEFSPNHIGYLCGVMDAGEMPPPSDHEYPARELAKVRGVAIECLQNRTKGLWPDANKGGQFDWALLVEGPRESKGILRSAQDDKKIAQDEAQNDERKIDSQYLRVNVDPSERYVLSAAGTIQYRLDPENTGVSNLFLAGDWVKTPMNVGSVEAAVMGGRMAARAISKEPIAIPGEEFAHPERAKAAGAGR